MPEAILGCFSYQMDTACHWAIVKLFPKIHGNGSQASKESGSVAGSNSFYQIPSIRSYGQRAIMALPGMRPLGVLKNNSHGFIQILEVLGTNQE